MPDHNEQSIQPVTPEQITGMRIEQLPPEVIGTFNELIIERWNGQESIIDQQVIVERLVNAGLDRGDIFAKHWLDVEPLFTESGWQVSYEKPGFNESGKSTFLFRPRA